MPSFTEGTVSFAFEDSVRVIVYDTSQHYVQHIQRLAASTAVDFVAIQTKTLWLIEAKDYRQATREHPPPSALPAIVAEKCRDPLSGLFLMAKQAYHESERSFALEALRQPHTGVVLHVDQRSTRFRTKPKLLDLADLRIKLRQYVRAIDSKATVASLDLQANSLPYVAS